MNNIFYIYNHNKKNSYLMTKCYELKIFCEKYCNFIFNKNKLLRYLYAIYVCTNVYKREKCVYV